MCDTFSLTFNTIFFSYHTTVARMGIQIYTLKFHGQLNFTDIAS